MNLSTSYLAVGPHMAQGLPAHAGVAGCAGASGAGVTPAVGLAPTSTPVPPTATAAPSDTPPPTATVSIIVTPTTSVLTVTPKEGDVPCRFGPGNKYSVENALQAGTVVWEQGREAATEWVQIDHPRRPGWRRWVDAAVAVVDSDLVRAPVVAAPEPFVESISIDTDPTMLGAASCTFPRWFELAFWITTNGHARVVSQRARQGEFPEAETTVFPFADTKQYVDVYNLPGPGDSSFAVVVSSPNGISEAKDFLVRCAS